MIENRISDRAKILLIDEDTSISYLIRRAMEKENYKIYIAGSGKQGMEMSTGVCPDLILMDNKFSDMEGITLIQWFREWTDCPIIILSERSSYLDKVEALYAGADDYMVKEVPSGAKEQALSSYTVAYDRQSSENTTINICGTQELSQDEITAMHSSTTDPGELAKLYDKVFKDTVITCTVTFTDGTSQKRQIGIGGAVMTYEELGTQTDEPVESPEDPSQKQAFLKLQIK